MCNCVEKIESQLLKKMQDEPGFTEVVEEPTFVNRTIYPAILPSFPIKGKYMKGERFRRTYAVSLRPTFCPFCGKKYKKL